MQVSARILGQEYGLTSAEMNRVLVINEYLEGEPGNYYPTEKAEEFVKEKYEHRGCGGYPSYNRYWTTRTFDDSIKDSLIVTDEIKNQAREEVKQNLLEKRLAREKAYNQCEDESYELNLCDESGHPITDMISDGINKMFDNVDTDTFVKIVVVGAGAFIIYKAAPRIKKWWKDFWEEDISEDEGRVPKQEM